VDLEKMRNEYLKGWEEAWKNELVELTPGLRQALEKEFPSLSAGEIDAKLPRKIEEVTQSAKQGALQGFEKALTSVVVEGVGAGIARYRYQATKRKGFFRRLLEHGILGFIPARIYWGAFSLFLFLGTIGAISESNFGGAFVVGTLATLCLWFGVLRRRSRPS